MEARIRATAYKVPIQAILAGRYVKEEDSPNYISIDNKKVSRVYIVGIVVDSQNSSLVVDDGTSRIPVRSFEDSIFSNVNIGDMIMIIGRPRDFNDERYIVPEIVRKTNEKWMRIWKNETKMIKIDEKVESIEEGDVSIGHHEKIINFIQTHDKGKGVEIEEVNSTFENSEKIIESMLKEGEIFENSPGKLKILE